MLKIAPLRTTALLVAFALAPAIHAEQGILTFVFGPSSQEAARQSARAALSTARHWMQTDGGGVEIRRAGSPDAQRFQASADPRELEQAFDTTAMAARDADPPSFLIALDAAAQAAALNAGARIVVAALNSPPFSSDAERSLEHLAEICKTSGVRVVVLDVGESARSAPNAVLNALVTKTNGTWVRQAKALESSVAMVAPADESNAPPAPAVPAAQVTAAAESKPQALGAIPKFEIPVHIRFIRISGTGSVGSSMLDHEADFGESYTLTQSPTGSGNPGPAVGGGGSMEVSYEPNDKNAPLQGMVIVESPLNALKFDIDDNTNTYQGRARIIATVRDPKGTAIWTGRREVNVHGPVSKLDERRQGSMYFMRSIGLPGQGPFTLEAKVEDLLAGTTGVIQTPLKTSKNAPGLVATDALVVRPFKGAADKFEADQVLSYEGEALSPVLNPVFHAERPIDLQIYLRLYPDIHGAPIDMNMEVLNAGRVVARIALPFKSGLASMAREGASSSIAGRADNMYGGQAKEFPYLVDLKGAKFPPGDYRGVISIHQGKSVIKRVVAFQVTGKASAAPVQIAVAAKPSPAPADEAENMEVVLPEIESAKIDESGLKMRAEEQRQLWEEASKNAMGYAEHLPNFRCIQETHRFTAALKTPDQLKEVDSFKEAILFEDGKQRYQRLFEDGLKADNTPAADNGIRTRNEFGLMLSGLFDPAVGASYKWVGHAMAMGVLCQVFEVQVSKAKTNFSLTQGGRREPVGYNGRVFIDAETGLVRRLTIQGAGLAKDFGLQSPALSLDYGMVKIGRDDYLLPLRSVLQLQHAKAFVRNETVFRNYRKFEAESQIKFQNN
ncbi:MAG TPA: hypothetical protein VMR62_16630 [Bryobacteraceae bacterium]|jgi:hypothetical protein|nr:hypothetical protein [Bryobacteraceae bacterium]